MGVNELIKNKKLKEEFEKTFIMPKFSPIEKNNKILTAKVKIIFGRKNKSLSNNKAAAISKNGIIVTKFRV